MHSIDKPEFLLGEHEVLKFWETEGIFDLRRRKNGDDAPKWSFLDGPITANNPMGVHHAWGRTYKDTYQRFFAMKGHQLRYQNGFDCQGLWVEVEVEKDLELDTREKVEAYGVDRFVNECKKRVLRFAARQTEQSVRLGYWMEWDDADQLRMLAENLGTDAEVEFTTPRGETVKGKAHELVSRLGNPEWGGSYFTFSAENNDTIWAFLKKCFERGKIYSGFDVMPWSGRSESAYSQMEVVEGRKLAVHTALFVRFPLIEREDESLLVWTTTPWTLTSNVAAAVNPDLDYVKVRTKRDGHLYYLAKDNLDCPRLEREFKEGFGKPEWKWPEGVQRPKKLSQIFKERGDFEVEGVVKGAELVGLAYRGPFDELEAQNTPGGFPVDVASRGGATTDTSAAAHRVIDAGRDNKGKPNVVAGEGTGIVHIAPGCGDVDHRMGERIGLAVIAPLDSEARFIEGFGEFTGRSATDPETVELVIQRLTERNLLVAAERYPHIYPHCWRTGTELVFRLVDEWFIDMDWRDEIKESVTKAEWLPKAVNGEAREIEWLTNMGDWMISKKRFWGLALPIWFESYTDAEGQHQLDFEVMGSLEELKERAVEGWDDFAGQTAHRPWLDGVKIKNPKTGNLMSRVPDVGNPWLDAGIVPFSTMSYNTDRDRWNEWFPADFVVESFPGQFRNWFYSLLAMSTMMSGTAPFKTLLGHRLVMNEAGKPMHKSDGTAIWFEEAAEQLGVDTIRWMYLAHDPASDLPFGTRDPEQHVTITTPDGPTDKTAEGVPTCKVESSRADDVRRKVLIPLWNSYAFLVNYAVLDEFDPTTPAVPVAERPEIDRWMLSNLQRLIATCEDAFSSFESVRACRAAEAFIDDMSTWYIRRNRRRFWRSRDAEDRDKLAAYQTLHTVMVTLCKLLAPGIPFLTERMYRNLTSGMPGEEKSVHLCDYPSVDQDLVDESLNARMSVARGVVGIGHRLRTGHSLRARQPLSGMRVAATGADATAGREAITDLTHVILDELNVRSLDLRDDLDDLVTRTYKPNHAALGPRVGKMMGAVTKALSAADPATLLPLAKGRSVTLDVGGEEFVLEPGDVRIDVEVADGWVFSEEGDLQVALDTELTPELRREGMARDFVRQVQKARKELGFEVEDHITIRYETTADAAETATALEEWRDYISTECQATEMSSGIDEGADGIQDVKLEGGAVRFAIAKSS